MDLREVQPADEPFWTQVKDDNFPCLKNKVILNTATGVAISKPAFLAGQQYYQEGYEQGDHVMWETWCKRVDQTRELIAGIINAPNSNHVVFTPNTSTGVNTICDILFKAGLFSTESEIIAVKDEFPSGVLPWLHRGWKVNFVESQPDGKISLKDIKNSITSKTKVLIVSATSYVTGFRQDLTKLGQICKENNIIFIVDGTQQIGAYTINVQEANIHFLVWSNYKWVNSGFGCAVLYISSQFLNSELFPALGWRSLKVFDQVESASQDLIRQEGVALEGGCPNFPSVFALQKGLEFIFSTLGITNISRRIDFLREYLISYFVSEKSKKDNEIETLKNFGIKNTFTKQSHRSGIVIFGWLTSSTEKLQDLSTLVEALDKNGVVVAKRGENIRVSVHYYTSQTDIKLFVDTLLTTMWEVL